MNGLDDRIMSFCKKKFMKVEHNPSKSRLTTTRLVKNVLRVFLK